MSLDRGVMLLRLNQELLPEPGKPIASTTVPFGDAGGATAVATLPATGSAVAALGVEFLGVSVRAPERPRPRPPRPLRREGPSLRAGLGRDEGVALVTVSSP